MSRQANRQEPAEPPLQVGDYRLEKVIGQGTYGKVRLGAHIETGENAAIKVIEKAQIQSPKQVARLQREIRFLKLLNHPHIVKVLDVIETQEFIYIIMEYAVGGELFDYIVANKRVKEREARTFFRMVLSAVDYCHQNAIIHRDLKPENLLLDDKKNIKIIDFGFGNNFSHTGLLDTFCGSPFYAAPEMILGKKYEGPEVDMWSLGVILFALLCGHLPFDDDNMKELYKKIANGSYKTPDYLPTGARHLIGRLITVDPKKRATLKEVLQHPWVNDGCDGPPQSFVPKRPIISDPATLSKDITNRLEIFGYTKDAIKDAFSPSQDYSKPNAIRATYFLLSEMVTREQTRLRALRRTHQQRLADRRVAASSDASFNTLSPEIEGKTTGGKSGTDDCTEDLIMTSTSTIESTPSSPLPSPHHSHYHHQQQQQHHVSLSPPQNHGYTRADVRKRVPQLGGGGAGFGSLRNIDGDSYTSSSSSAARLSSPPQHYQPPNSNGGGEEGGAGEAPSSSLSSFSVYAATCTTPRSSTISASNGAHSSNNMYRRQSVPLMIPNPATAAVGGGANTSNSASTFTPPPSSKTPSPTEKLKEELRAVSGWFLNFSTTSGKSQQDILGQLCAILGGEQAVSWTPEGKAMFQQQVDVYSICGSDGKMSGGENGHYGGTSSNRVTFHHHTTKSQLVGFQVEILRIPRTNLNAIHFKRLSGGVWNYKKVCNKILSKLSL